MIKKAKLSRKKSLFGVSLMRRTLIIKQESPNKQEKVGINDNFLKI